MLVFVPMLLYEATLSCVLPPTLEGERASP